MSKENTAVPFEHAFGGVWRASGVAGEMIREELRTRLEFEQGLGQLRDMGRQMATVWDQVPALTVHPVRGVVTRFREAAGVRLRDPVVPRAMRVLAVGHRVAEAQGQLKGRDGEWQTDVFSVLCLAPDGRLWVSRQGQEWGRVYLSPTGVLGKSEQGAWIVLPLAGVKVRGTGRWIPLERARDLGALGCWDHRRLAVQLETYLAAQGVRLGEENKVRM